MHSALGDDAYRFIDFLHDAGFSIWQMLPVNSTDRFGSPYQGTSVHAGNPHLINLYGLAGRGWLQTSQIDAFSQSRISLTELFHNARTTFQETASGNELTGYKVFKEAYSYWLDDYSLFSVIKTLQENRPWWEWPPPLRSREELELKKIQSEQAELLEDFHFEQYIFFNQWQELIDRARDKGILLLGDLPILVAHDSVDVWAYQRYFKLDDSGQPVVVAGVPPDYFSATGQRWGNPLYNWQTMAADGYRWWLDRLKTQLQLFDMVRIDHFRGFTGLWEIDAGCRTAEDGQWQPVPGRELFTILQAELGDLPLIAEDLGIISPEVEKLRDDFHLPGMKVLMFAFDSDEKNPYLPHNHVPDSVVYTGTHDNDTTLGWFYNLDEPGQQRVLEYLQYPNETMPWPLINTALQSVCRTAVLPMQDILGLDGSHRMNTPGTIEGNWLWRFQWEWISPELVHKLKHLNRIYGRI